MEEFKISPYHIFVVSSHLFLQIVRLMGKGLEYHAETYSILIVKCKY
jgi:hypothetical protein